MTTIRRRDLPTDLQDYDPQLLTELCEGKGWSARDILEQVDDDDTTLYDVKRRLDHCGVEPDTRKSPHESTAADLWMADPEDYGLTSTPSDWDNTVAVDTDDTPEVRDLSDFAGGNA